MSKHIRVRPSLLGGLLWTGLGLLFLLSNFGIGADFWSLAGRYWPVLLILLGLGKILEYFLKKDAVSIRFGEIVGIVILLLIGTAITRATNSHIGRFIRDFPIHIGDRSLRPGEYFGESHRFSEEKTYPLESSMPIRIENSYGKVSVFPGSDREIRVRFGKVVYEDDEARAKSIASEIRIKAEPEALNAASAGVKPEAEPGKKSGPRQFVIRTNRDDLSYRDYNYNTDLEVFVPKHSDVKVVNNSGDVKASEIDGKLDLATTHRSLEVRDCTGQFKVSTRYAESRLINLKGDLDLEGAHGRLYVENLVGDLTAKNEYAPMEIHSVEGKVTVSSSEGALRIDKVTKPVVITARGTQVRVSDLNDSLKLTTSHRNIEISRVASRVTVESRYANISLKNLDGDIDIDSSSDNVSADEIRGRFSLKARGTRVRINEAQGPLDIQTTLKDVVVNDFGSSCSITNEYANVKISSTKLGSGNVNVKNRNGDVNLFLPENASFIIDATARNGRVRSDYKGLAPTRDAFAGSLKSKVNGGGPSIVLQTEYSDIHIYRTNNRTRQRRNRPDQFEAPIAPEAPEAPDPAEEVETQNNFGAKAISRRFGTSGNAHRSWVRLNRMGVLQ